MCIEVMLELEKGVQVHLVTKLGEGLFGAMYQ
jgi:hypothetical protein